MKFKNSFHVASASVRANLVPMVVLWLLAAVAVGVYYRMPGAATAFWPLAQWQASGGWVAAFLNRVIFCGVIPGVFLLSVKSIRPQRPLWTIFVYSLWGGCWGVACDAFYTLQSMMFRCGTDVVTLAKKAFVDQFVWNVFICTPVNAVFFPWVARDFHRGQRIDWRKFFAEDCVVLLLTNWIVWIPVTVAVYAFPLPLQIQLAGLACSFWMLVALRAAAKGGRR